MAISLSTHQHFQGQVVNTYAVVTKRCRYLVEVERDLITIRCPGLEHEMDRSEHSLLSDPDMSNEGVAAIAVIYFEESNQ
jgi:hypothetical protein